MWATVQNTNVTLSQYTDGEIAYLDNYLGMPDPNARFRRGDHGNRRRMLNLLNMSFPTGLLPIVLEGAAEDGYKVEVIDRRVRPCAPDLLADVGWLFDFQDAALDVGLERGRGIFHAPTGSGKCLGRGTPVLRYDGTIVPVEHVCAGDLLMGADSQPRTVLATTRGQGPLYRIVPVTGDPWVCNDAHVLTLVHTETGAVVDIPLNEYLRKSKYWQHCHKQFSVGVQAFGRAAYGLLVSPYFLGVWLGDGGKDLALNGVRITKPDPEILAAVQDEADCWGMRVETDSNKPCPTHRIVGMKGRPNLLKRALAQCVKEDCTVVPEYLCASTAARAELLAGMLDTDGHHDRGGYDFVQKRKPIADAAVFLARSLGLRAVMSEKHVPHYGLYWRVHISGDCTILPLRIPRKRAHVRRQKKDDTRTGFRVEPIRAGDYFGFTLDGDGRFLLGDFTVTHNTELMAALACVLPCTWGIFVPSKSLLEEIATRFESRTGEVAGRIGEGVWRTARVTVATFQSVYAALRRKDKRCIKWLASLGAFSVDECFPAGTMVDGVPIEHVRVGDVVRAYDARTGQLVQRRVRQVFARRASALVRVHLANGQCVVCTPGHPFLTDSGTWLPAYSLCGQRVLRVGGGYPQEIAAVCQVRWVRVDGVEVLERGCDGTFGGVCADGIVYNLEVDGVHTYTADGVVVHNCHHLPADTFWQVAMACPNAYWRYGYSATPFDRGDRKSLLAVAAIGPGIYRIEQKTLVDLGVIAKARVELVKVQMPRAEVNGMDWSGYADAYDALVALGSRNRVVMAEARKAKKPALVFVSRVEHGKLIAEALTRAGTPAEFMWGEKATPEREAAVRRLEHGDTDVIVANVVFQAGINIPTLATVINAAGGKSHIAALQQAGRGSRRLDRAGNVVKDAFTVVDLLDVGCGCRRTVDKRGVYDHKPCQWLHAHARSRRRAYLGEGYEVIERS